MTGTTRAAIINRKVSLSQSIYAGCAINKNWLEYWVELAMPRSSSLVPRPTPFFALWFALTITHGSRRQNGEGLGAFIM